jgi:Gly-Xaa carboxypeptidase
MPPAIKRIIVDSAQSDTALQTLEGILSKDRLYRSQIGTTQAIDVVSGGVKSNALPEQAHAIVNHRISTERSAFLGTIKLCSSSSMCSSVRAVRERNTALLKPLAERFNLAFNAFGVKVSEPGAPASGHLALTDMSALEPAPVTPTSGGNSIPYQVLSGSIRATYNTRRFANGDDSTVIVAPSIMSGNTGTWRYPAPARANAFFRLDTRYYWKLSSHIFRYGHGNSAGAPEGILSGIHTVNECAYTIRDRTDTWLIFCATAIDADDFVEMIRFFVTLILNSDESIVL